MKALVIGPDAGIGDQLRSLGAELEVVADLHAVAQRVRAADDDLVLAYGDIATNREALAGLVDDPRIASGMLAAETEQGFLGVLKVAAEQCALLAETAERVARERDGDALELLASGLMAAGVTLRTAGLRGMVWERPASAAAWARVAQVDEEQIRLDGAVKSVDGFFTTFFVSPYSRYIARWAARRGLTPNQVTITSLIVGILCAAAFATGERWGLIAGAVLLQVAFTLDCVDGQLARYTRNFSQLGGWLDATFDRAKEWIVYAGLAIGGTDVWVLAGAALTLQTFRHMVDFCWQERRGEAEGDLGRWGAMDRIGIVPWIKRIIAFPIGERFAAISITAAIWSPRTTFIVLLAWGGFAALYGTTGRILRSLRLRGGEPADVRGYRDDGPLARVALAKASGWMLPPLIRGLEYGGLITFGALAGDSSKPAAFALIAALALRHYDIVYGLRFRGVPVSERLGLALGGWDSRLVLGCVLLILNLLPTGFYAMAAIIVAVSATATTKDVEA
jgi:phosphatidylglycerophosphate synthase